MEELLGRQPPHSAPAEQAVIGAMLIDPSCIPDVIEKVTRYKRCSVPVSIPCSSNLPIMSK